MIRFHGGSTAWEISDIRCGRSQMKERPKDVARELRKMNQVTAYSVHVTCREWPHRRQYLVANPNFTNYSVTTKPPIEHPQQVRHLDENFGKESKKNRQS